MPSEHSQPDSSEGVSLTLEHRLRLAQEIAQLVKARLPLEQSLRNLSGQTSGSFSQAVAAVQHRLQAGQSLSSSLAQGVDPATHMLAASIELGELSGALDQALDGWVNYYLTRQRYTQRLTTALLYPLLLVCVAVVSLLYSIWKLLPQYRQAFAQLAEIQPKWLNAIDFVNNNFVWLATGLIAVVTVILWRSFGNRQGVDRWSIPRSQPLRSLFYSRVAHMSRLCVSSGQPVDDWIGLVMRSVGLKEVDPMPIQADALWARRLGKETCGVLVGLAAGQLSAQQSDSLLQTIDGNLKLNADMEIERQAYRWPTLTSAIVGSIAVATYLGLIYLPWLTLYYHIAH